MPPKHDMELEIKQFHKKTPSGHEKIKIKAKQDPFVNVTGVTIEEEKVSPPPKWKAIRWSLSGNGKHLTIDADHDEVRGSGPDRTDVDGALTITVVDSGTSETLNKTRIVYQ